MVWTLYSLHSESVIAVAALTSLSYHFAPDTFWYYNGPVGFCAVGGYMLRSGVFNRVLQNPGNMVLAMTEIPEEHTSHAFNVGSRNSFINCVFPSSVSICIPRGS